jgi:hypothetical protein
MTTSELISLVAKDEAIINDATVTSAERDAADFRLCKNMSEIERRAFHCGDEEADKYLASIEPFCDACQQHKPCSCDDMERDAAEAEYYKDMAIEAKIDARRNGDDDCYGDGWDRMSFRR